MAHRLSACGPGSPRPFRTAVDVEASGGMELAAEGKRVDGCRIRNPRLLPQAGEYIVHKDDAARVVIAILLAGQRDRAGHNSRRAEPGIDLLQTRQAAQEHARARHQEKRDRHLAGHQHSPQPLLAGASCAHANRVRQPQSAMLTQDAPHRRHPGTYCRRQSDRGCRQHQPQIRVHRKTRRQVVWNCAQHQPSQQGAGQHPKRRGNPRQEQDFADEQSCNLRRRRAKRNAQGKLARASRGARKEQAGNVEARNEQHAADNRKERDERFAQVASGIIGPGRREVAPSCAQAIAPAPSR